MTDTQNLEKSHASLGRLNAAVEELIGVIKQQRNQFQVASEQQKKDAEVAQNKIVSLEAQIQSLTAEKDKMAADLTAAQNNTEAADKIKNLEAQVEERNSRIGGLQTEVQNLNAALSNRKTQLEEAENKNKDLAQKLTATEAKLAESERSSASNNSAMAEIQSRLEEQIKQKDELSQKYQASEQKISEMQQTISQTTENIDDVVARLEKVLQENGTGNNNN